MRSVRTGFVHDGTVDAGVSYGTLAMVILYIRNRVVFQFVPVNVGGMTFERGISWFAFRAIPALQWAGIAMVLTIGDDYCRRI